MSTKMIEELVSRNFRRKFGCPLPSNLDELEREAKKKVRQRHQKSNLNSSGDQECAAKVSCDVEYSEKERQNEKMHLEIHGRLPSEQLEPVSSWSSQSRVSRNPKRCKSIRSSSVPEEFSKGLRKAYGRIHPESLRLIDLPKKLPWNDSIVAQVGGRPIEDDMTLLLQSVGCLHSVRLRSSVTGKLLHPTATVEISLKQAEMLKRMRMAADQPMAPLQKKASFQKTEFQISERLRKLAEPSSRHLSTAESAVR